VKEAIWPSDVTPPGNPYSPAIRSGALVCISGQVAKDSATGAIVGETMEEQARVALENLRRVAKAAGAALEQVVKVTVYLRRGEDFGAFNKVYAEFFAPPFPARSTVVAPPVNPKVLVEVEAFAVTHPEATP
jgi:2-iminobutanoate/2-iminopropanoate deaminase